MRRLPFLVAALLMHATPPHLLGTAISSVILFTIHQPLFAQPTNIDDARFYLSRSVEKRAAGDFQGALSDLNTSITIAPDWNGRHYVNRGDLRQQLGDSYGAISDYNQSILLGDRFGVTYRRRGVAKAAIGDHQAAINDYNTAIELLSPPRQTAPVLVIEVHILRGNAWRALGGELEACSDYKMAVYYGDEPTSKWLMSDDGAWCRNMS